MPILEQEEWLENMSVRGRDPRYRASIPEPEDRGFVGNQIDKADAILDLSNSTYGLVKYGLKDSSKVDHEYNPRERARELIGGTPLEAQVADGVFDYADSDYELRLIIDKQKERQANMHRAATTGILGSILAFGGAVLDPAWYFSFKSAAALGKKLPVVNILSAIGKGAKGGIAVSAVRGALVASMGATAVTTVRSLYDSSVDEEDFVNGIIGGAVIGGVLGGVGKAFTTPTKFETIRAVQTDFLNGKPIPKMKVNQYGTVSVAVPKKGTSVSSFVLDDSNQLAALNRDMARAYGTFKDIVSVPTINGFTSRSATAGDLIKLGYNNNFILKGHLTGKFASGGHSTMDAALLHAEAATMAHGKNLRNFYTSYASKSSSNFEAVRAASAQRQAWKGNKLPLEKFDKEVVAGIFSGVTKHSIPEVQQSINYMNKFFLDYAKKLKDAGIFKKDIDLSKNPQYFSVLYAQRTLRKAPDAFRKDLQGWLQKYSNLSRDQARKLADSSYDDIMGMGDKHIDHSVGILGGVDLVKGTSANFTKARAFNFPPEVYAEMAKKGYITSNLEYVVSHYSRRADRMIAFQDMMKKLGTTPAGLLKRIKGELKESLRRAREAGLTEKQIAKIERENTNDFNAMKDILNERQGKFLSTNAFTSVMKKQILTSMLGGVLISSLGDSFMIAMNQGLSREMKVLGNKFMKNYAHLKKTHDVELRAHGQALETFSGMTIFNKFDQVSTRPFDRGVVEKVTDGIADQFGGLTGMNHWNRGWKVVAGHSIGSELVTYARQFAKGESLKAYQLAKLRRLGFNDKDIKEIAKQSLKYDSQGNFGLPIVELHKWKGPMKSKFAKSIVAETNNTILTPSAGDIPLVAQKYELGKLMFMFKSFSATATNRIMLSGLQRTALGDPNALMGLVMLVHAGGAVDMIKTALSGKDSSRSYSEFLYGGFMRSGVGGLLGDFVLGAAGMATGKSRWASAGIDGFLLGPAPAYIDAVTDAIARPVNDLYNGKLSTESFGGFSRVAPYSNLFYLKAGLDYINPEKKSFKDKQGFTKRNGFGTRNDFKDKK